ncbi:MAG: tail fiber domain-containing protein, partial [Bacteroidota bacterium]
QTATGYDVFYSTGDTYSGGALEGDLGFDLYFATYTEGFARFDVGENGVSVNDYTLPTSDGASGQLLATDGIGTLYWENDSSIDDQMVDKFELSGTTLQLSLENDGQDDYTADLSSLQDNLGNHTATQNIQLDDNWISNDGSNKGISVTDDGYVGIGINPATKALLEVSGEGPTVTTTGDLAFYSFDGWNADVTSLSQPYSIYASGRIAGLVFHAISDERVKDIQGISDSKADLETLQKIQITDYQFKDQLQNGNGFQKKVIAQQVAKVYPQAVQSNTTEVVPDIYQKARVKDGWIELATDLKVGERVKIITEKSNAIHEVTAIENGRFQVARLETDNGKLETIFVYGRQVNDFHTVDYEAISMLNVSATQELARENEELKKRVEVLENQVTKINQLEVML